MTAEIAILNLQAAVLAADSAATTPRSEGQSSRIFTSANKLFALSTVAPVGILFYVVGNFRGIPWEPLVKEYRHKQGSTLYDRLEDYGQSFCDFLENGISSYQNGDYIP